MKITIITVCYNDNGGLAETLISVANQTYKDIEHIVVDGGTVDLDIEGMRELKRSPGVFISEADNGIYDAMNKGTTHASGSYIAFLNSSDVFSNDNVIEDYVNIIISKNYPSAVYSHLVYIKNNKISRKWYSVSFKRYKFLFGWMMPHPTVFSRADIICSGRLFDTSFEISADYDWMLRTFYFRGFKPEFLNKVTVRMQAGGVSNSSCKSIFNSNMEVLRSWAKYTKFVPFWLLILKPLLKITQFIK